MFLANSIPDEQLCCYFNVQSPEIHNCDSH